LRLSNRSGSSRRLAPSEELLGAGDIQSLADLGNSCGLVRDIRVVPFGLEDISPAAAVIAVPFLPLLLTIWTPKNSSCTSR